MCEARWSFKVLVIGFLLKGCHLISTGSSNGTAEILWNLSKNALLQGNSQTYPRQNNYGLVYPNYPSGFNPQPQPHQQSFMDVLASVAYNDELHCVPKLLCELTSGSRSPGTAKQSSFLPFSVNMESLLGLLSSFNSADSSPLLLFGRAALLGYTSQGNPTSCAHSYPQCPNDPDKLINYLNNYNGGFFRYFNGVPQKRPIYRPYPYQYNKNYRAEGRILTNVSPAPPPPHYIYNVAPYDRDISKENAYEQSSRLKIKFPQDGGYISNEIKESFYNYKSPKGLVFPESDNSRQPKTLIFPVEYDNSGGGSSSSSSSGFDFQRPLPNHVATPMIFPTRTGTGELILDSEIFERDYSNGNNNVAFI